MCSAKHEHGVLPKLVLVGRMGVGKSSLFARLNGKSLRRRESVAFTQSTRDWVQSVLPLANAPVHLVDTAGAPSHEHNAIQVNAWQQTQNIIQQAWGVILVTDATAGLLPQDKELAHALRVTGKLLAVAANKADSLSLQQQALCGFSQLGLPVYPVSTHQGLGIKEFMGWLEDQLPSSPPMAAPEHEQPDAAQQDATPCFVVLGKPNAGKSTFLNSALQQDRYLTSEIAGTTAQAVSAVWQDQEGALHQLIDTAGLRRKSHVQRGWERAAVSSTTTALRRAQVAVLLIDACVGVTQQDVKIASLVHRQRRGLVLVASKWDAACQQEVTESDFLRHVHRQLPFVSYAPLQFVSAWDRNSVLRVLQVAKKVHTSYHQRLSTSILNRCLHKAAQQHRPVRSNSRLWKLYFGCQDKEGPPLFYIVCNRPKEVEASYERYLIRCLRTEFGFEGVPLKLLFRARERREMRTS